MRTSESWATLPRGICREGVDPALECRDQGVGLERVLRNHFTSAAGPVTLNYVNGPATGESVDAAVELAALEAVYGDCRLAGRDDQIGRQRDQLRSVALLVIAETYCTDQPRGWRVPALRALEFAQAISRAYGMRHAIDDLGDLYLCCGDRPMVWLGHTQQPVGGIVWSAGQWPDSIDEFGEPRSVSQVMERAAFLDGLYRRAVGGREPHLDAEHVALLRAAEWRALADRGVERRRMPTEGLELLCFDGSPRTVIGCVGPADVSPSFLDMTASQRAHRVGDLTAMLPESLGPLETLRPDFTRAPEGSPLAPLFAEVVS